MYVIIGCLGLEVGGTRCPKREERDQLVETRGNDTVTGFDHVGRVSSIVCLSCQRCVCVCVYMFGIMCFCAYVWKYVFVYKRGSMWVSESV